MIYENLEEFAKKIEKNRRLAGLDFGMRKIGMAFSDETRTIASPFSVYARVNIDKDLGYFRRVFFEEKICGIVLGLPLELDGSEGEPCATVRNFAQKLIKKAGLPIFLQDERMSTKAVSRSLRESHLTGREKGEIDDKLAAAYVLQGVLDRLKNL